MSAEASVVRNYIEVLTGLPWSKKTKIKHDLGNAEVLLNEDHYGLENVKDRNMDPATSLDGKYFDNPTFAIIADHLKCLNIGGKDEGLDLSPASQSVSIARTLPSSPPESGV
jgi:hypothetical protein